MAEIGEAIVYVDEHQVEHAALVTYVWGEHLGDEHGVNLVYVSADEAKQDPYGRQIERATSVVHKAQQVAPGVYWRSN